jgi:hypothetical protein
MTMPKRGQSDRSPGDARKPFSDQGGPGERHARTHDVRREAATNPTGPEPQGEDFAADIAPMSGGPQLGGHAGESVPADEDKRLHERLSMLDADDLARIPVLEPGARLEQGGVYINLNDLRRVPFKAIGGQEASASDRYVAKRDVDYELWNRLVEEDRETEVQRPV